MMRNITLTILATGLLAAACVAPAGPAAAPAPASPVEPSPSASVPAPASEAPATVSPLRRMAAPAIDDLAARLGVAAEDVEVVEAVEVEWPDASLGCPAPGFSYAQVLTDGMKVTLQVGDKTYDYRGRSPDTLFLCGPNGPVPPGEVP